MSKWRVLLSCIAVAVVAMASVADAQGMPRSETDVRIAVVGAGPSGLTAAHTLRSLGYESVVVFEKEDDVGGKVKTTMIDGKPFELGAIIANHDYKTVLGLADEFDLSLTKISEAFLVDKQGGIYTYQDFVDEKFGYIPFLGSVVNFAGTMLRHQQILQPGFLELDPELYESMSTFATEHHIEYAMEIVRSFMTGCGYGYYEQIPAQYLMKLIPWLVNTPVQEILSFGLLRGWSYFDRGWQQLWREVAKGLDVRLNAEVTNIVRTTVDGRTTIAVTAADTTEQFDRVIIAAPLDAARWFMDVSEEEAELFGRIRNLRYLVTVVRADGLFQASYYDNVTPDTIGHINFIVHQHPETDIFVLYQLLDDTLTTADALRIAEEDIAPLGGKIREIITQKSWTYFPHVGTEDLKGGYYQRLENLQGEQGTYYVGGIMSFETVEHTARYAKDLIEREFPRIRR